MPEQAPTITDVLMLRTLAENSVHAMANAVERPSFIVRGERPLRRPDLEGGINEPPRGGPDAEA